MHRRIQKIFQAEWGNAKISLFINPLSVALHKISDISRFLIFKAIPASLYTCEAKTLDCTLRCLVSLMYDLYKKFNVTYALDFPLTHVKVTTGSGQKHDKFVIKFKLSSRDQKNMCILYSKFRKQSFWNFWLFQSTKIDSIALLRPIIRKIFVISLLSCHFKVIGNVEY